MPRSCEGLYVGQQVKPESDGLKKIPKGSEIIPFVLIFI